MSLTQKSIPIVDTDKRNNRRRGQVYRHQRRQQDPRHRHGGRRDRPQRKRNRNLLQHSKVNLRRSRGQCHNKRQEKFNGPLLRSSPVTEAASTLEQRAHADKPAGSERTNPPRKFRRLLRARPPQDLRPMLRSLRRRRRTARAVPSRGSNDDWAQVPRDVA